ncbi:MAG: hypothetical protein Q8R15_01115 [Candidatus Micrarchaeota archaeon]|nr:hypothetical protein [Candidatus Micrarchaeota archaeon]
MPITFRIDDVSVNTPREDALRLVAAIAEACLTAEIVLAVSPLVHDVSGEVTADRGRAFPRVLNAMSDHRLFFQVARAGVPAWVADLKASRHNVRTASHGLVHVDHRLLGCEAQELSIVTSCSLVKTQTFVPPFNHWNKDTENICQEHEIELIKFESGWRHVRFNAFDPKHDLYYLHTHDTNAGWLRQWFKGET